MATRLGVSCHKRQKTHAFPIHTTGKASKAALRSVSSNKLLQKTGGFVAFSSRSPAAHNDQAVRVDNLDKIVQQLPLRPNVQGFAPPGQAVPIAVSRVEQRE